MRKAPLGVDSAGGWGGQCYREAEGGAPSSTTIGRVAMPTAAIKKQPSLALASGIQGAAGVWQEQGRLQAWAEEGHQFICQLRV